MNKLVSKQKIDLWHCLDMAESMQKDFIFIRPMQTYCQMVIQQHKPFTEYQRDELKRIAKRYRKGIDLGRYNMFCRTMLSLCVSKMLEKELSCEFNEVFKLVDYKKEEVV